MEVVRDLKTCPRCGQDTLLMRSIMDKEIEKGNVGADIAPNTEAKVIVKIDARRPPLVGARVPAARVFKDICTECMAEVIVRIEKGHAVFKAKGPPEFV